jgi:hypothetical protein
MEIIREKLLEIKSSSYSQENKYNNKQIELIRNEWGLL